MMKYYSGTFEQLKEKVAQALTPDRYQHCLRVSQTAKALAEQNGVDPEQAAVAGLVHDYAKQRPDQDFIQVIKAKHLDPDLLNWNNAIWHGVVGAEMIHDELGITDPGILQAVRDHTTGAGASMSTLSKIIFTADYIEPGRDFPGVDEARKLTEQNLDLGVTYQLQHTVAYLVEGGRPVYPASFLAYNYWIRQTQH
ncbi:bis(5'-nucleosyl)-tetraphosphatase (symmetrical) YqeK [Leuconostocaceae bacterium ESL0723]|nr:bis(5'-nucleosyl)-tetraphosphatase (symmetrical) YqeK [Leuconostocaceae bacterium ESL0723]